MRRRCGQWAAGIGCGLLGSLLSGCGLVPQAFPTPGEVDPQEFLAAAAEQGFDPLNVVIVGAQAWAVREDADGSLTLASFGIASGSPEIQGVASQQGDPGAAETASMMGASNDDRWMVVAGRVRPDVARVELGLGGEGGWVHDGLYVIALPGAAFRCEEITWRMLAADGSLLRDGSGLPGGQC